MAYTSGISGFAQSIFEELGSPSSVSVASISGWSVSHIGDLNVALDTCICADSGLFTPALGTAEVSIYQSMYMSHYYDKMILGIINGIGLDTVDWTQIKEGDSSITRTNRAQLLMQYRGLKKDNDFELAKDIGYYKQNLSAPIQVAGDDAPLEPYFN